MGIDNSLAHQKYADYCMLDDTENLKFKYPLIWFVTGNNTFFEVTHQYQVTVPNMPKVYSFINNIINVRSYLKEHYQLCINSVDLKTNNRLSGITENDCFCASKTAEFNLNTLLNNFFLKILNYHC